MSTRYIPWGPWSTTGFTLLIFLGFLVGQIIGIGVFSYFATFGNDSADILNYALELSNTGKGVIVSFIPGAIIGVLMTFWFVKIRKINTLTDYLHLHPPRILSVFFWLGVLLLFAVTSEFLARYLERDIPAWMTDIYETAGSLPLLWITLVVAAPLFEEILVRGFMLEGFRHTRLGDFGAVLLTAALWAAVHIQYEFFEIFTIFIIGIILGYARLKSGSLYTPIILHAVMNFIATLQIALLQST
ncbi:MAG: Unknown protein [uncultured Thiotrichaceae bacterium]|uniref:CAAX prenyl protease 2/Lysostaphin resistance protein A-like domain-containing protein n=1 Tax=uncultured Thiotrichaceae bacterium TaxID=298394 RepID=A0A6S6U4S6_9GAMM|nr:MAG: Unknown protein [uncultured Thiotrichaceae bacterium]